MAPEDSYRRRLVDDALDELFQQLPAISVIGPRAAGKTTTLERRAATVVHLDDDRQALAFRLDPAAALRELEEPVLLDEWQAVPGVLGAVRRAVDADWRPGRFLISGSVRAAFRHPVWPGTGRIVELAMYPMSVREQRGERTGPGFVERLMTGQELTTPRDSPDLRGYVELAVQSGFPRPVVQLEGSVRARWLRSYVANLVTHDLEQLEEPVTRSRDPQRLRRYLAAFALNSAGVVDQRTLHEAAGISKVTGTAYEDLLLDLLVAERVPAWFSNRLRRLTHQPKRYLIDAGLIPAVVGVDANGILRDGNLLGRVIETFVVAQIRPEVAALTESAQLHHLRTQAGRQEVDLVLELSGGRVIGIEAKATSAPSAADAKHLRWLRDQLGDRFVAGVVLHTGPWPFQLDERIVAAPISTLWG
jgi:predicted AAA+ superfamily ATPase